MTASGLCVFAVLAACRDDPDAVLDPAPDAGPDAPPVDAPVDAAPMAAPDLRFQWVGASTAFKQAQIINIAYYEGSGIQLSHTAPGEYAWSPLQITVTNDTPASYSWQLTDFTPAYPIEPIVGVARSGMIEWFENDLAPHLTGNEIVTSLDIFPDAYAFVTNGTASGTPAYRATVIDTPRAELDAEVAREASAGHVVTALSASPTGQIRAYSFAREGDSTAYETSVLDATTSTLAAQATALAAGGYIITGFGHIADDALVLVGTRTPGAAPRTITVKTGSFVTPDLRAGDAVVAWILHPAQGSVLILQR
jgi:hypothetical protein